MCTTRLREFLRRQLAILRQNRDAHGARGLIVEPEPEPEAEPEPEPEPEAEAEAESEGATLFPNTRPARASLPLIWGAICGLRGSATSGSSQFSCTMKIAFVSTYPPAPCGIGEYARNLLRGLSPIVDSGSEIQVIAEDHASISESQDDVHRYWQRGRAWQNEILKGIDELKPDIVHVQHEEALLHQDKRFPWLLEEIRKRGIASVVTLHSVYKGPLAPPGRWAPKRFHRALGNASQALIVHQEAGCADVLREHGVPANQVAVIPHGTQSLVTPSRADARQALGLDSSAAIVLFFGVIHPKKNLHVLLKAFEDVALAIPGAKLLVAGKPRQRNILDKSYTLWLESHLMRNGKRQGWLDYRRGFVPDEVLPAYLAAADIVAFPHKQRYGSASGVLHLALSAGRAVVCSRGPKFTEAIDYFSKQFPKSFPESSDSKGWARGIIALLEDQEMREQMEGKAADFGRETDLSRVARQHLDLYTKAIRDLASN